MEYVLANTQFTQMPFGNQQSFFNFYKQATSKDLYNEETEMAFPPVVVEL